MQLVFHGIGCCSSSIFNFGVLSSKFLLKPINLTLASELCFSLEESSKLRFPFTRGEIRY